MTEDDTLGLCAWCGKHNEQLCVNQLLFPGRKFCSKKCLFDCKNAENPAEPAPDTPHITAQSAGNVFTSFVDAFDYTKEGDALMFSKGTFKLEAGYYIIDKPLTLKAANNDVNAPLSEKSIIQSESPIAIEVSDEPINVTVDGIAFCGSENSSSEGAIYIEDCAENATGSAKGVVIKNCSFTGFSDCISGDDGINGITIENCSFKDSDCAIDNVLRSCRNIQLKNCVFENIGCVFSDSYVGCKIENCQFINSAMTPGYDVPADNAQSYNERTKKTYICLQTAIDEAQQGDVITLAPGAQCKGFYISEKTSLVIKGAVVNTNAPENQKSIIKSRDSNGEHIRLLGNTSNITFEGIVFDSGFERGFSCDDTVSNITFKSCEFQGNQKPFNNAFSFFDCVFTNCHRVFFDYKVKNTGCRFENCDLVYGNYCFYIPIEENCKTADGKAALSFGIAIGDTYNKIVAAGADISSLGDSVTFATSCDNQTMVDLHIYAALSNEEESVSNCIDLGVYNLSGVKEMPKGENKIEVEFTIVDNHWLKVLVLADETNRFVTVSDSPFLLPKCLSSPKKSEPKKNAKPAFCAKCGAPLKEGARFCVKCGTKI